MQPAAPLTIANIMLSRGRGGIEQSSLDYAVALQQRGHHVHFVTDSRAIINHSLPTGVFEHTTLRQHGKWDMLAAQSLRNMLDDIRADVIITHGNRALCLASLRRHPTRPLLTVAHNYKLQHLHKADRILCITRHLMRAAIHHIPSVTLSNCSVVPNMVTPSDSQPRLDWHNPPHIAAMGRLVEKKGFDVWLRALSLLKKRNVAFIASLAGGGPEEASLLAMRDKLGLSERVQYLGWVDESETLYEKADIFCLPSLHEPFGIVALEAMNACVPLITTASEGPSEILADHDVASIVPCGDAGALADALEYAINHPHEVQRRAIRAARFVRDHYSIERVGKIISHHCLEACNLTVSA